MGRERKYDGVRIASASSIEIDFYYAGKRHRERLKLQPTPANLKRAAQHLAAIQDAITRGVFDYATTFPNSKQAKQFQNKNSLTVAQYLDNWLVAKEPTLKASTFDGYLKIVNGHLIPSFGKMELHELTRSSIKQWAATLEAGNKTISNVLSCFRAALQEAFEDELITSNPLFGWVYKKSEPPKQEDDVDPFSKEEQDAILSVINGQVRNLIRFAFWTGLRTSELVALNWDDVDFKRNVAIISKAQTQASKGKVEATKTRAGTREVKLLPPALAALLDQKSFTFLKGDEIFQNPRTQERWQGDQPIRQSMWIHALRLAGVRYRNPYQTRHTYASMMLSAGESPVWLAKQMGHSDLSMINRRYGRWMKDADPDAGQKAVAIFSDNFAKEMEKKTG